MRRPTRVEIASIEWKIVYSNKGSDLGNCVHKDQTIIIRSSLPKATMRHVLLHEILHAIWYSYGVNPDLDPGEVEESIINILSGPLVEVMNNNPQVVKFLFEEGIWA